MHYVVYFTSRVPLVEHLNSRQILSRSENYTILNFGTCQLLEGSVSVS